MGGTEQEIESEMGAGNKRFSVFMSELFLRAFEEGLVLSWG